MNQEHDFSFLNQSASAAASQLLGSMLQRRIGNKILSARIVETEAYDQSDAASHSYKGKTQRTNVMFGPPGYLYVYFTYGIHYCCNVVVGRAGEGSAVLIRGVEPLDGIDEMIKNRGGFSDMALTNGPAKFCQAFGIDMKFNGHDLQQEPLRLIPKTIETTEQIVQTTRIGISKAKNVPWRFYIKDNKYVSKK